MIRRNGHPSVAQGASPLAKPTPASPIVAVPVRVALLSDSALFRSGLHRLLRSDPSFLVAADRMPDTSPVAQQPAPHPPRGRPDRRGPRDLPRASPEWGAALGDPGRRR